MTKTIARIAVPVLILAVGATGFAYLRAAGEPPERIERPFLGPLVEAIEMPARRVEVVVEGQGTVRPSAEIDLVPQVSGLTVWKSPNLVPGGTFAADELLLQIDARDYDLARDQAEAAVAQARYRSELAREEADLAREEWERISAAGEQPSQLVLRIPQLQSAEADLKAATARLEESELRLARTRIRAPFDGRVRHARVDVGQHLNAGQPVGRIYSIEQAEIVVPLPDEDLAWFALPRPVPLGHRSGEPAPAIDAGRREQPGDVQVFAEQGAAAVVTGSFAGRLHQWSGRVVRTEGELDPQSRMVRLVVEVDEPYGGVAVGRAPLTVGMFVEVAIQGRPVDGVRVLPRGALRQGGKVWAVAPDGVLRVRDVRVLRAGKEEVLVEIDMGAGEGIVVSQLSGVTDGMKVRVAAEEVGS